jgi:hypothetical protein
MSPQAISPHKVQQFVGVIGAPRLGDGRNGRPLHGQGLSVMDFNARGLLPLPRRLEVARLGVTFGRGRARISDLQPPLLEIERVPSQTQPTPGDRQQQDQRPHQGQPPQRRQRPHQPPHG